MKPKINLVYSTNPNQILEKEEEEYDTLDSKSQQLRVRLETKHRAGKKVTVILGFEGTEKDLEDLAKSLKNKLGVGGSAKDGEIVLQGDIVQKVKTMLILMGYKHTK